MFWLCVHKNERKARVTLKTYIQLTTAFIAIIWQQVTQKLGAMVTTVDIQSEAVKQIEYV